MTAESREYGRRLAPARRKSQNGARKKTGHGGYTRPSEPDFFSATDYMVFIIVGLAVMPAKEVEQFQGLFPRIVVATQETLAQDGVTDQPAHILGEDFSVDDTNPKRVAEMLQYFRRIFT